MTTPESPSAADMSGCPLDFGPDDYPILTRVVHIMRYGGRNDDGHRFWRLACGSRLNPDNWNMAFGIMPEDIERMDLAVCGRCRRTNSAREPRT